MKKIDKLSYIFLIAGFIIIFFIIHTVIRPKNNLKHAFFSFMHTGRELGEIDDGMYANMSLAAVQDQYSLLTDWNVQRYKATVNYHYYLKHICKISGDLTSALTHYPVLKYQARLMFERLSFLRWPLNEEELFKKISIEYEDHIHKGVNYRILSYNTLFEDRASVYIFRPENKVSLPDAKPGAESESVKETGIPVLIIVPEIHLNKKEIKKAKSFYMNLALLAAKKGFRTMIFDCQFLPGQGRALDSFAVLNRFYRNRLVNYKGFSGLAARVSDLFLLISIIRNTPDFNADESKIFMAGFGKNALCAQIAAALNESIKKLVCINGFSDFKKDTTFWDAPFMLNNKLNYNLNMGFKEFEHYRCLFSIFPRKAALYEIFGSAGSLFGPGKEPDKKELFSYECLFSALEKEKNFKFKADFSCINNKSDQYLDRVMQIVLDELDE